MPRRRAPKPVWVILRCVGRPVHTWRHDDSNPFGRPEYCLYCRAPHHRDAQPDTGEQ